MPDFGFGFTDKGRQARPEIKASLKAHKAKEGESILISEKL